MNQIEKLKENHIASIFIVCAIVIPIAAAVTSWFYEKQKVLILLKHDIELERYKNALNEYENRETNYNNDTLKKMFNGPNRILISEVDGGGQPVILEKIDQGIEITDNSNPKIEDDIKYSHIIFVNGADGISIRNKVLEDDELKALQSGKSNGDNTYIDTLMNGHKVEVLSRKGNWYKVKTRINGEMKEGFISGSYKKIPTVKPLNALLKWKGKWYTTWANPMSYETENKHLVEFFNNEISTFYGKYSYTTKQGNKIEGKIQNIKFDGDNIKGDWIEAGQNNEIKCKGTLEFLMFSDNNCFIGRFMRDRTCETNAQFRIWKGKRVF